MDLFRRTLKTRDNQAETGTPVPVVAPSPPASGVKFGKQFTEADQKKQANQLAELLRKRGY